MDNLKDSFEDVADWCEKHLEDRRGQEIGMIVGAMLRAYGRLATLPSRLHGDQRAAKEQQLNAKAERFLLELSARSLEVLARVERKPTLVDSTSRRTNMTYDASAYDTGKPRLAQLPTTITNMVYDADPRRKP